MNAADVVGWTYDADVHCNDCAKARFGSDDAVVEAEDKGYEVHPIFGAGDDAYEDCFHCGGEGSLRCGIGHPCEHECSSCEGSGQQARRCGDCGEALIE